MALIVVNAMALVMAGNYTNVNELNQGKYMPKRIFGRFFPKKKR